MSTTADRTNWAGNVVFGAARTHRPRSVDELCELVAGCERIRAVGTGHSFSLVADTSADLVSLGGLPPVCDVDPSAGSVTVSAGSRYADIVFALHDAGVALANLASLPHISVAGSVATGTHGSGDTVRCLSAAVSALELVTPDGRIARVRRGDPGFEGSVVALGALGPVTRVTLDVEPAFAMTQHVRVGVPLDQVAAEFDAVFGAAYSVSVFTDWAGAAQVWLKRREDRPDSGWVGGAAADRPLHPVPGMSPDATTGQLGAVGPWHERLPHFRPELGPSAGRELQSEYLLPRGAGPAAIAELRGLADRIAPVVHICEVRTVAADGLWLSPAYGRDSVAFHFTWLDDIAAVTPVMAAVEDRLTPLGARPHWGKLTAIDPPALTGGYERAEDFSSLLAERDPEAKFANDFTSALFPR